MVEDGNDVVVHPFPCVRRRKKQGEGVLGFSGYGPVRGGKKRAGSGWEKEVGLLAEKKTANPFLNKTI